MINIINYLGLSIFSYKQNDSFFYLFITGLTACFILYSLLMFIFVKKLLDFCNFNTRGIFKIIKDFNTNSNFDKEFFVARFFGIYAAGLLSPSVILLGKLYYSLDITQFAVVILILLMVLNVLCSDCLINIFYKINKGIWSVIELFYCYFKGIVDMDSSSEEGKNNNWKMMMNNYFINKLESDNYLSINTGINLSNLDNLVKSHNKLFKSNFDKVFTGGFKSYQML